MVAGFVPLHVRTVVPNGCSQPVSALPLAKLQSDVKTRRVRPDALANRESGGVCKHDSFQPEKANSRAAPQAPQMPHKY